MNQNNVRARRDPLTERVFLDRTQRLAQVAVPTWPRQVEGRLQLGQCRFGDRWTTMSVDRLLEEIAGETLDTGAWSTLAVQALVPAVPADATTVTIGELLAQASAHAAAAHALTTAARGVHRRAGR